MFDILFGSVEIVPTHKVDGDKIYFGSYSILRGRNYEEVSRTENSWNIVMENVSQ